MCPNHWSACGLNPIDRIHKTSTVAIEQPQDHPTRKTMWSGSCSTKNLLAEFLSLVMLLRCFGRGSAFVTPSALSAPVRHGATSMMSSSAEPIYETTTPILLEPTAVSSKVFSSDRRPIILFDGGTCVLPIHRCYHFPQHLDCFL